MRCPDCSKFVSMENGDPEINSMEAMMQNGDVHVDADVHAIRNCADCGTELKSIDLQMEEDFHVCEFDAFKELSLPDQKKLTNLLNEDHESISVEIDENGGESEDGGGGRYQKNMIQTTVHGTITVTWERGEDDKVELTKDVDLQAEEAASSYDECC